MVQGSLTPDTIVDEKLRVVRVLGVGGMGVVYEVEHVFTKHRRVGPSAAPVRAPTFLFQNG
ncbi:hypothetical protein D3C83_30650 [compost metagenome]